MLTKTNCIIAQQSGTNYNSDMPKPELIPYGTQGGQVQAQGQNTWRLSCPGGKAGQYRLAQLDDYHTRRRVFFPWQAPCCLKLEARASGNLLLGTWGFGLWNDPFGMKLGFGGGHLLPALPDAAWFFFASQPNYLSFRDHLPANGALAAVFRASGVPLWLLAPLGISAPLLLTRWFSRLARRFASNLVQESAVELQLDWTEWHAFELVWRARGVQFMVDGALAWQTTVSPRGPLGLVLWLDNQYAAWLPDGQLKYGTLETGPRWIEIRNLSIA